MAKKVANKKAKKDPVQDLRCRDCALGEVVTDVFSTLSVRGEPTLKTCPYHQYKRLLSERACERIVHS